MSSPFHSGMNHWQRQWLSDRLHGKHRPPPNPSPVQMKSITQPLPVKTPILKSSAPQKRKAPPSRPLKISWPSSEVLEKLLWEKPTSQIAKNLGVSDKAVEKHCKKLALKKPPRGHWAKVQAGKLNSRGANSGLADIQAGC